MSAAPPDVDPAPREGLFGWMRLALGAAGVALVPGWILITVVIAQLNPWLSSIPRAQALFFAGAMSLGMLVPTVLVVLTGVALARAAGGWWRDRSARVDRARWAHVVEEPALDPARWDGVEVAPEEPDEDGT